VPHLPVMLKKGASFLREATEVGRGVGRLGRQPQRRAGRHGVRRWEVAGVRRRRHHLSLLRDICIAR